MRFDFVVGNPPYQDNTLGQNESYAPPIYHIFIEEAQKIANAVELITPARFLFNAGSTPKAWNKKMLNDEHTKVLLYEPKSKNIFDNTDIKGGVAITYIDKGQTFEKIGIFTAFNELNEILKKVKSADNFIGMNTISVSAYTYHLTENLYIENPELKSRASKGHEYDLKSNVFEYLADIFYDQKPNDGKEYVQVLGRKSNERVYKYIKKDYLTDLANFYNYKVFIAGANGTGALGEVMSTLLIGSPLVGTTESFMSIGYFSTEKEAANCMKYIKTKFSRTLLGVLKVTQNITPEKYLYVPLQDFTSSSDIDWSKSLKEIDQQLYKKYKLTADEIKFIETNVKEME